MAFIGIKDIIVVFYFAYWLMYNQQPFSLWILIIVYVIAYLFLSFLTSIIKKSSDKIKEDALDIKDTIKRFEDRLKKLEDTHTN